MYNHILAQPRALANVVKRNCDGLAKMTVKAAEARNVFLIGIGTSYHAAQIASHLRYFSSV